MSSEESNSDSIDDQSDKCKCKDDEDTTENDGEKLSKGWLPREFCTLPAVVERYD